MKRKKQDNEGKKTGDKRRMKRRAKKRDEGKLHAVFSFRLRFLVNSWCWLAGRKCQAQLGGGGLAFDAGESFIGIWTTN